MNERKLVTGVLAAALGAGITVLATTSLPAVLATHKPTTCSAPVAETRIEPEPPRPAIHFHHRSELPKPPPPPAPPAPAPVA